MVKLQEIAEWFSKELSRERHAKDIDSDIAKIKMSVCLEKMNELKDSSKVLTYLSSRESLSTEESIRLKEIINEMKYIEIIDKAFNALMLILEKEQQIKCINCDREVVVRKQYLHKEVPFIKCFDDIKDNKTVDPGREF